MQRLDPEDRETLRGSVNRLLDDRSGPGAVRDLIESEPPRADRSLWKEIAGLGWTGLLIPELLGGSDAGMTAVTIVLEGLGSHTTPGPYLSSAVLAPALLRAGASEPRERWLPALASGEAIGSIAVTGAGGRVTTRNFELITHATGRGGRTVAGTARYVLDGEDADVVIAGAIDPASASPVLLALPTDIPGLSVQHVASIDRTRSLVNLTLDQVAVDASCVLAEGDDVVVLIDGLVDTASVALAADGLGAAARALDMSVEYAKQRVQFGRVIGSFQAIKHKLADMFVLAEGARAAIEGAAEALDLESDTARRRAATAGSFARAAASRITGDAVQAHGGVGFTWEHDCHLLLKRAKFDEIYLTDLWTQRERLIETYIPAPAAS